MTASESGKRPGRLGVLPNELPSTIDRSCVSNERSASLPFGYVQCGGSWVRAQMRSVAVVITVTGRLDDTSVAPLAGHLARFTRLGDPLIVDVNGLDITDARSFTRLVSIIDAECHLHRAEFILVADEVGEDLVATVDDEVLLAHSLAQALQLIVWAIRARRQLPLAM